MGIFVSKNIYVKKSPPNHAIVIGGGIAGCATAHALANRGVNVTLLERHAAVAQEASGNPIGVLYPRLAAHANHADAMAISSYLYTLRLLNQLALDYTQFGPCGLLQLAFNSRETARIEGIAVRKLDKEIVRFVNKEEASDLAGAPLLHDGLYFPDAGWVNPRAFCQTLVQHPNITVRNHVQATQLSKVPEGWQVTSQQDEHWLADAVVIANANDALQLAHSSHLPVTAVRGQMTSVTATAKSAMLNTVICTEGYLTPAIENNHCIGATFDPRDASLEVREADNLSNLNMLTHMSPELTELKIQPHTGRAALRCSTPDYLPLAGKLLDGARLTASPPKHKTPAHALPWHEGLYVNIGHGTKGLTTAPLCAEILAGMMVGDPLPIESSLAQALDPNRFLLKSLGLKRLVNLTV